MGLTFALINGTMEWIGFDVSFELHLLHKILSGLFGLFCTIARGIGIRTQLCERLNCWAKQATNRQKVRQQEGRSYNHPTMVVLQRQN